MDEYINNISKSIIRNTNCNSLYKKVYRSTNENLTKIFSQYEIKDKTVLTVLASSDQLFSMHYLGAKEVDTFDNNEYTYLYFFLKKWCTLYTKKSYLSANTKELLQSLEKHNNTNEEIIAYKIWKNVLNSINNSLYYSEFFHSKFESYSLPYIDDMDTFIEILEKIEPNYRKFNLFNKQVINKKYDIVVLSNILDYMFQLDNSKIYEIVANNLSNMVTDDGIIICSNLLNVNQKNEEAFHKLFIKENGIDDINEYDKQSRPINFVYRKKF